MLNQGGVIQVDEKGQLIGFSHHDGRIKSINFLENSNIDLHLIGENKIKSCISLKKVRFFIANNLREGNIVDRTYLWHISNLPDKLLRRLLNFFELGSAEFLQSKDKVNTYVFWLECSYGAEMVAVLHDDADLNDFAKSLVRNNNAD